MYHYLTHDTHFRGKISLMKTDDMNQGLDPAPGQQRLAPGPGRDIIIFLQKSILLLARFWYPIALLLAWIILGSAFLAPALMSAGFTEAGQSIYDFLAPHDHQLPQRSYFLFGESGLDTYSLEQVLDWGADPQNLRAFVGNAEIGYKMALNQRMTAIFVAIVSGGFIWGFARTRFRLRRIGFILLTLPLLLDGISHMISDNSGAGFRDSNAWAVALTGGVFPTTFYEGATFGTLNWLLRTVTGLLFGFGLVWFLFTYLAGRFDPIRAKLEPKLRRMGAIK
jgi:uncharacterized membrane protein